ncbi:MAG TPA: ABC-2 family transporter protein [Polyangiaceae bacterium]
MRVLRAYPTLLRVGFAGAVAYRAEMLVWMLTMTMPLVSLALWSAVAATAPVGRFGQREFVGYFLATVVVRQLTGSWVVWELIQEIKSGALATRLLKPIHPLVVYSADNIAAIPLRTVLAVPMMIIAMASGAGQLPREPLAVAALLLSLSGAWLITFFVMTAIGTLSFFMESSYSIFEIWLACFMLLSGYLLPLELFPEWVRATTYGLPFRYMLSFPVEILLGLAGPAEIARGLVVQWIYCLASGLVALVVWRAGLRRFGAFGG